VGKSRYRRRPVQPRLERHQDASGKYVYVSDVVNNNIQKFDSDRNFLVKWGSSGSADGQFGFPATLATDASGYIYVADHNNQRIQKFDDRTPQQQTSDLKNLATNLTTSNPNLPSGTSTSLTAKLNDALNAIEAGDTTTACSALGDFINQVNAQAGKKKISQSDADSLIAAAKQLMTAIGCQ
jgi:DNA-binding beta-propeller fold protein YncE